VRRLFILAAIWLCAAAAPAVADERETVYSANDYTVYREAADYCTLYLDLPQSSMIRISYRSTNSAVFLLYVRDTIDLPSNPNIWFRYDDQTAWEIYKAVPYREADYFPDSNGVGFSLDADLALLNDWSSHRKVRFGAGDPLGNGFAVIDLSDARPAIEALLACPAQRQ